MDSWHTFIEEQLQTPNRGPEACFLTPLPPTGILRISGADAAVFLQGQATCDVRTITRQHAALGAFCNPEGRVIANFRMVRREEDYLILLPGDLLQPVMQRLKRYVLRSKVQILEEPGVLFGLITDADRPPEIAATLPEQAGGVGKIGGLLCIRMPDPGMRWLLLGAEDAAREIWHRWRKELPAGCLPATHWQLREIRSGIPWVNQATSEAFLPQMLNLDLLGAIGFDKGCYTGQEIIARTHYRGQVKRRTYRAEVHPSVSLAPGDKLLCGDEAAGTVIDAATCEAGQELLAVVRCDRAQSPEVFVEGCPKARLEWLDLAYTLP